ncbi:hypothetical protein HMI01_10800 [Halolactibacillus miurensis]|uniref:Phage-related protein n=1 Tax=Halolactibacillus miurensis TaxID=306541 RepID=A0A1I6SHU2_9BACI|nr:phage tail domain-containing protein [Halolactibacillus miurensis]GEM04092.1 hypothetical protein HMI01_10800 [Halolactibacillus miurensis]SFS76507.1 Phage-related protein [Halolactibacillus miurensis]
MIILDGQYKLSDFGLIEETGHDHPSTPSFSNVTFDATGRDGLQYMDTDIETKTFFVPVGIVEHDKVIKQKKLRDFARFWLDDYAKPREVKLSLDYEKEKEYTVRLNERINPTRLVNAGRFNLFLTAYDPYAYNNVLQDEINWGSETIDFEDSYLLGHEGSTTEQTLTAPATLNYWCEGLALKPKILISGSADNLVIKNGTQEIIFPDFANADWSIDCKEYEVLLNGAENFNALKLRDFWLYNGMNNVEITGSNINITIRFVYRDKWE